MTVSFERELTRRSSRRPEPVLAQPPNTAPTAHLWTSGELLGHYAAWRVEYSTEEIVDCASGEWT